MAATACKARSPSGSDLSMPSLVINVSELLTTTGASREVDEDLAVERVEVGSSVFPALAPAHVRVTLTNTGAGIVAHGSITLRVEAQCARCVREFETELAGEVEAFYVRAEGRSADDLEIGTELIGPADEIDLAEACVSALVLEAPFAPLHTPECRGLCASCGADLNEGLCGCEHGPRPDSPFAKLRELFEDGEPEP